MSRRLASVRTCLFLWLALTLLLPSTNRVASAAPKDRKEMAAKRACLAGDYGKGVALLADLFVASGDINHLFNQGRCFEQNGRFEEAIVRFLEYQRKNPDKGSAGYLDAERHIADCQALLDKRKPSAAVPPAAAPAADAVAAPVLPSQPIVSPGAAAVAPPPAAQAVAAPSPSASVPPASLPAPAQPPAPPPALDVAARPSTAEGPAKPRPVYKTWWFWTGAGVVAAGAVTAAIVLSSKPGTNAPSSTLGGQGVFQ